MELVLCVVCLVIVWCVFLFVFSSLWHVPNVYFLDLPLCAFVVLLFDMCGLGAL